MKSEQLQKWALTAEIVGGLGVLITLIILVTEIRSNTNELRFEQVREAQLQIQESSSELIRNSDVYIKSLNNPEELTASEALEIGLIVTRRLNILQTLHQAFLSGIISEPEWHAWRDSAPIYVGHPFGNAVWQVERDYWNTVGRSEFTTEIDFALQNSSVLDDRQWLDQVMSQLQ